MKIAAVQMVSTPDVDRNLDAARLLIAQAAAAGARLVALPEYFCLLGRSDRDKLAVAEQPGDGPIQQMLSAAAREHALWLVGGTLPLRISGDSGHVRNACCVYSPQGTLAARYDKMHLFGFDDGNERHDESRVLEAGSEVVALDLEPDRFRLGLSICYDLRFPELYRKPARRLATRRRRATCSPCPRRSPTRPARRTGNCCCARVRWRTRPT